MPPMPPAMAGPPGPMPPAMAGSPAVMPPMPPAMAGSPPPMPPAMAGSGSPPPMPPAMAGSAMPPMPPIPPATYGSPGATAPQHSPNIPMSIPIVSDFPGSRIVPHPPLAMTSSQRASCRTIIPRIAVVRMWLFMPRQVIFLPEFSSTTISWCGLNA